MTKERIYAAITILTVVAAVALYYVRVVVPNDEVRWAIIQCMEAKGDLHSEAVYRECVESIAASR